MSISRASIAKQLQEGLNAVFGYNYKSYENQHLALFDVFQSEKAYEEDVGIVGFPAAPSKTEGASVTFANTMRESYVSRYLHDTVALAFAITEEALEDNLYVRDATKAAALLGRSMAYAKQIRAATIYNRAFNSIQLGGDGVVLCSASHPLFGGGAGTFSNTAGAVDLSEAALENAIIAISKFPDDQGIPVAARAQTLIVPVDLQFVADRLLESTLRPDGRANLQGTYPTSGFAPNDINAIKHMGMLPGGYAVNNFLTDTNAWFIRTDVPDGMKHFERTPLQTKTYADEDSGNIKYRARERYSFGWSDWRGIYGASGST